MKIIKPPTEKVSSGKTFRPSSAFRNKLVFEALLFAVFLWLAVVLSWMGISFLVALDEPISFEMIMETWFVPVNLWTWYFNIIWLIPSLIGIVLYVERIEYSVISETGETMPEVYVRKGLLNITHKHVPFRTITNISVRAGPFDRLFRIGSIDIETAGFSGQKRGPEEKLEGFSFYQEVRDFILNELRKFRAPYTTATESLKPTDKPVIKEESQLFKEMLTTLKEIRDLLEKEQK